MLLVEYSNHALDQIFSGLNRMRFGCMHEALEVLVLIVGDRGTEHQNAQTRKIFSCFI
ncbi:hypothetical protein NC653_035341 [Populus alba x Populus x berolinensis]|uniref:Uncharacterized protein n=1 Tax=Populus alba x Populus x berolinensis TaxID=444605 RepID=A0AAD6LPP9_9ROSI|nr:hypothetical protein NC653_035341 [Populus alba x Populus x berolinensis]